MTDRAVVFKAVRDAMPDVFDRAEYIALLDAVLDVFGIPRAENDGGLRVSKAGIDLIKQFEGCRLDAYPDPGTGGEPWTIGYGATRIDGKPVPRTHRITQTEAEALLADNIESHAAPVRQLLAGISTTQGQFDALVSFAFNVGPGPLSSSTLLKLHKAGDHVGAAAQFARWNRAGTKVLAGLTRRRAAEAELYGRKA